MNPKPDPWLPTRHTLLAKLKDKSDDRSWQEFFDLYGRLIYSVATQSGLSHVESEDVVQDTVLSVMKKIEQFKADRSHGSFKAWLRQLIQWRIRDRVRKRRPEELRRAHRPPQGGEAGSASTATEDQIPDPAAGEFEAIWDREERHALLRLALDRLKAEANPRHYQIFQMAELEQQPVDTVAAMFGVSRDQVYLITHRLRNALQAQAEKVREQFP